MRERKIFCIYMPDSAYHAVSKEVENRIFRHNWIFRHKLNFSTHWESSRIIIFSCKFYIVTSHTLEGGLFLGYVLFVACRNIIRASWETNKEAIKIQLQKSLLTARPPFYYVICCLLRLLPPPFQRTYLLNDPFKDT